MAAAGLPIPAGIAMLDLTAALLAQGKAGEAEETVKEAARLFVSLGMQCEALQAVILLRDAFRMQAVNVAMVQEVASFLRRLLSDRSLCFEARAWEEAE
jgi:hypothetical protein